MQLINHELVSDDDFRNDVQHHDDQQQQEAQHQHHHQQPHDNQQLQQQGQPLAMQHGHYQPAEQQQEAQHQHHHQQPHDNQQLQQQGQPLAMQHGHYQPAEQQQEAQHPNYIQVSTHGLTASPGTCVISGVQRGSPAWIAGVRTGDTIQRKFTHSVGVLRQSYSGTPLSSTNLASIRDVQCPLPFTSSESKGGSNHQSEPRAASQNADPLPTMKLRSHAEVIAQTIRKTSNGYKKTRPNGLTNFLHLSDGLSMDQAIQQVKTWAADPNKSYTVPGTSNDSPVTYSGSFNLVKNTSVRSAKNRGEIVHLDCGRCGHSRKSRPTSQTTTRDVLPSLKCDCKFQISLEHCTEGCQITAVTPHHNHDLAKSIVEANANSATRAGIPEVFRSLAEQMSKGGSNAGVINHTLRENAAVMGVPVTWTYNDIYNRVMPSTTQRAFDSTDYIAMLQETGRLHEYHVEASTGEAAINPNELSRVFDVKDGGLEAWSRNTDFNLTIGSLDDILDTGLRIGLEFRVPNGNTFKLVELVGDVSSPLKFRDTSTNKLLSLSRPDARDLYRRWLLTSEGETYSPLVSQSLRQEMLRSNMVIYDTTFATNRYGFKLGLFVTVDAHLRTIILAQSLLLHETKDDFVWAFNAFKKYFKIPPTVLFTDSDPAMAYAIKYVFPSTRHLLCTYHLSKNIFTHFHTLLNDREGTWPKFIAKWWSICLEHRQDSTASFDHEWGELRLIALSRHGPQSQPFKLAMDWLDGTLKARKEQWAARYTWGECTYGCHSTQRIESLHSGIKVHMKPSSLLTALHEYLHHWSTQSHASQAIKSHNSARRNRLKDFRFPPSITGLQKLITPEAYDLITQQAQFTLLYTIHTTDSRGVYRLSRTSASSSVTDPTNGLEWAHVASEGALNIESANIYTTSMSSCSCQYPTSWYLPCRHQIALGLYLRIVSFADFVGPFWYLQSTSDVSERVDSLLALRVDRVSPRTARDARDINLITVHDTTPLFRRAQSLCKNQSDITFLLDGISELVSQLRNRHPVSTSRTTPSVNNPPSIRESKKRKPGPGERQGRRRRS